MELQTKSGAAVGVSDAVFAAPYNETLVHQVVTAFLAGARSGNSAQKNRAAVRGGGAKPWRQKGTGRARAGTIRSPIWRAGGVTFASSRRDYSKKVNKKMYRGAMRSVFSELARSGRLSVVDTVPVNAPKAKELRTVLQNWDVSDVLIIDAGINDNLHLAGRNFPTVTTTDVDGINPWLMLRHENVVITEAAVRQIEERLS
ncbi:50S ribosomal protein L4 [Chromatiales bacterium (ex Bugula neritina AB1)]|nr:50S ribosomal protein L4 [Chromatiales bacterium (ex Bugula neritina AB1)]